MPWNKSLMLDRPDPIPRLAQRGGYARLSATTNSFLSLISSAFCCPLDRSYDAAHTTSLSNSGHHVPDAGNDDGLVPQSSRRYVASYLYQNEQVMLAAQLGRYETYLT